jgi:hypothetical protein
MGVKPIVENSGEAVVASTKHKFHVLMWDVLGNKSYQKQEISSRRFSESEVVSGLVQLAETARLMMPRDSPGLSARYVYASVDNGHAYVREKGIPCFDAYLREQGVDIVPVGRDNYARVR